MTKQIVTLVETQDDMPCPEMFEFLVNITVGDDHFQIKQYADNPSVYISHCIPSKDLWFEVEVKDGKIHDASDQLEAMIVELPQPR